MLRYVVCLSLVWAVSSAAPAGGTNRDLLDDLFKGDAEEAEEAADEQNVFYDQRQNGTENYRLDVNGVTFVIAPPELLLAAALEAGAADGDWELTEFEFETTSASPSTAVPNVVSPGDLDVAISTHRPVVVPAPGGLDALKHHGGHRGTMKNNKLRNKLRFPGAQFLMPFLRKRPNV